MSAGKSPIRATDLHDHTAHQLSLHRYVYTRGRRHLVTILAAADCPMTLPNIVTAAPELPASSVYRNLDVLERCDVVRRIRAAGDYTHFELAEPLLGHHHHLICVGCGEMQDIHLTQELENLVERNLAAVADRAGFVPLHHSLDLHGRCGGCQTR